MTSPSGSSLAPASSSPSGSPHASLRPSSLKTGFPPRGRLLPPRPSCLPVPNGILARAAARPPGLPPSPS
jgi:hypothetical protein